VSFFFKWKNLHVPCVIEKLPAVHEDAVVWQVKVTLLGLKLARKRRRSVLLQIKNEAVSIFQPSKEIF